MDYLLFSAFFVSSEITLIATILVQQTGRLIFFQTHNIFYVTSFLLLFFHALRVRWERSPKVLKYFGIGWYTLLLILTLFWKVLPQPRPDKSEVLFLTLPRNYSSFAPLDAGIKWDGSIIYSSGNCLLGILFFQFVLILMIYAYMSITVVQDSVRVRKSKRLFIISWVIFLIWTIMISPWLADVFPLPNALLIITIVIVSYISLELPEGVLISHSQLYRAKGLYKLIEQNSRNPIRNSRMEELIRYLHSVPAHYIKKTI